MRKQTHYIWTLVTLVSLMILLCISLSIYWTSMMINCTHFKLSYLRFQNRFYSQIGSKMTFFNRILMIRISFPFQSRSNELRWCSCCWSFCCCFLIFATKGLAAVLQFTPALQIYHTIDHVMQQVKAGISQSKELHIHTRCVAWAEIDSDFLFT